MPDEPTMLIWSPDGVYADGCAQKVGPPTGPTVADLAAAVVTIDGTDAAEPSDVTVGVFRRKT